MTKDITEFGPELPRKRGIETTYIFVDPGRCRIRIGHNRDMSRVTAETCAGTINSIRSGGQETAVIGRLIDGDPKYDIEIVAGALRHFAVSEIRKDRPELMLLVDVRVLTDKEAFLLSDRENRHTTDLSDREIAFGYLRAYEEFYGRHQGIMAEELQVTETWLSRFLAIARLPPEVVEAFHDPASINITHASKLAPALNKVDRVPAIFANAALLATEQEENRQSGAGPIRPSRVLQRLLGKSEPASIESASVAGTDADQDRSAEADRAKLPSATLDEVDADQKLVASGFKQGNDFTIRVTGVARRKLADVEAAVSNLLARLYGDTDAPGASTRTAPTPSLKHHESASTLPKSKGRKRATPSLAAARSLPDAHSTA